MRMIQRTVLAATISAAFSAGMMLPLAAHADTNAIQAISSTQQGSSTVLRIDLKNAMLDSPASFTVANPPRVAIDLPDTDSELEKNLVELSGGDVRSVNVVRAGGKSRVVLNLKHPMSHTATIQGNTLVVTLDAPITTAAATTAPSTFNFSKGDPSLSHSLRDIDFRRGKDGAGRVVVELSDASAAVDIRQQGSQLVVDFPRSKVPENLRRKLDVTDFGTPVRSVRTFQQGDLTRMVIEPTGLWEHNAYQSDTQFVVEVKPVKEDPNKLRQGSRAAYKGERLSLNFQNVDVRALLQVIADFTNLNIVTSDTVTGNLTLRLKDVPWDQALDIILQARGLDMRKTGNVILVAPREELATKEKLDLEAKQQVQEIEQLQTETFSLNYQKAEDVAKLLGDEKQRVLSKRGSAVYDARTNKVFIQDTASRLEDVRRLMTQLDVPVRQVLIEARIVEADDRFSRNLGAKLGYYDRRSLVYQSASQTDPATGQATAVNVPVYGAGNRIGGGTYGTISGNMNGSTDLSTQTGTDIQDGRLGLGRSTAVSNTNFVNLPAAAISGAQPGSFALSLFGSSLTKFLNLELSALEADQRGKVVSSPRVLTANQKKALIEQGTELPYQQATSSGATSISFRKANLKLEVTPQITPEGNVILDVDINRDAVGALTPAGFAIDTRHVRTQVLVENGGTVVIGGIYEQFERQRVNKVPLLGDIPIIGYLFKNTMKTNDRTELLVFLTPRVVQDTVVQN